MYAVTRQDLASYDVALPEAGLGWERVGPLFERYSIALVGRVDEHWAETYQRIVESSPNLTRFRLEKSSGTVSFTCRATDGPVEVMGVLRILGEMLERVNREASFTPVSPDPRTRPGRPSPTSAAAPPGLSGTKTRF